MIQVTILLVRWQHWGGRSSTDATIPLPPSLQPAAAMHATDVLDPSYLNVTSSTVPESSDGNGTSVEDAALLLAGKAHALLLGEQDTSANLHLATSYAVAYPRLHVLVLAFSIFTSLVTAMQTAVMLAATNEDSAWKSKVMKSWTTFMLSCTFFFCDGYVHISSFASFATVFRQLVFLPLAIMIGTDTFHGHSKSHNGPMLCSLSWVCWPLHLVSDCFHVHVVTCVFCCMYVVRHTWCHVGAMMSAALVCLLLTRAFGQTKKAFLRALFVSPLLSFVDFPLLAGPRTGFGDYWYETDGNKNATKRSSS